MCSGSLIVVLFDILCLLWSLFIFFLACIVSLCKQSLSSLLVFILFVCLHGIICICSCGELWKLQIGGRELLPTIPPPRDHSCEYSDPYSLWLSFFMKMGSQCTYCLVMCFFPTWYHEYLSEMCFCSSTLSMCMCSCKNLTSEVSKGILKFRG